MFCRPGAFPPCFAAKAAKQRVAIKYREKVNALHTWVTREGEDNEEERAFILDLLANPEDPR